MPAAHACGRASVGTTTGAAFAPLVAGEELRQPVVEEAGGVEERAHDLPRLLPTTGARQARAR